MSTSRRLRHVVPITEGLARKAGNDQVWPLPARQRVLAIASIAEARTLRRLFDRRENVINLLAAAVILQRLHEPATSGVLVNAERARDGNVKSLWKESQHSRG